MGLIPMAKLNDAFEMDERINDLRQVIAALDKGGDITIEFDGKKNHYEEVGRKDCPEAFAALTKFFHDVIAELERDMRAIGVEPTKPKGARA